MIGATERMIAVRADKSTARGFKPNLRFSLPWFSISAFHDFTALLARVILLVASPS